MLKSVTPLTVVDSVFVRNAASGSGGVLSGFGEFTNTNFSKNTAGGDGGVGQLVGGDSSFEDCIFFANEAAPSGKGALFHSEDSLSIVASSIQGFENPNSDYLLNHESSETLFLDRVSFEDNQLLSVHSTGSVAIRNCPDISNVSDIDVPSDLLIGCNDITDADENRFCPRDYCTDKPTGFDCYCLSYGDEIDPKEGTCSNPIVNVPQGQHEPTILVTKPDAVKGKWANTTLLFTNKGSGELIYSLQQRSQAGTWLGRRLRQAADPWTVKPPADVLEPGVIAEVEFSLDSTNLQARGEPHTTHFSLLTNSVDEADQNISIAIDVYVSAAPNAALSSVMFQNPDDVVAGDVLEFDLTPVDETGMEILDASYSTIVSYSAELTHSASNTVVQCGSVLFDSNSGLSKGDCELPGRVCNSNTTATAGGAGECDRGDLSPSW